MNLKLPSQSEIPTCIVYAPRIAEAKRWDFPKQPRLEDFCPVFFFPEDFFPVSVFHEMKQERPVKFTRFIGPVGDLKEKTKKNNTESPLEKTRISKVGLKRRQKPIVQSMAM